MDDLFVGPTRRVSVLFPMPLPEPFDYAAPVDLELAPGDHVTAPLGGRVARGVVWRVPGDEDHAAAPSNAGGDIATTADLKLVEERLPAPPLPAQTLKFVDWVARYSCQPPGNILRMALRGAAVWAPPKAETVYALAPDGPNVRATPARQKVLDLLSDSAAPRTGPDIARTAGVGVSVIKGLADAGVLTATIRQVVANFTPPDPNRAGLALTQTQDDAAEDLRALIDMTQAGEGAQVALLDGVTGSGKTEVYFEAIAEALRRDETAQVLVLLPEIALTQAVLARFADRFGAAPAEWHSDIADGARKLTWRAVADGRAQIIVGARSALFLPFANLKLIVVDEEHDGAYKQDEGACYQARDMAVVRARMADATLVLASATPSVESLVNAQRGRYEHIVLPGRPGASTLPSIETIDLRRHRPAKDHWLSVPLIEAVEEAFSRSEQSLLFLNRRGYAPLVICRACGQRMKAPDTDSWLVEHRYTGRLVCHVTGFSVPKPKLCPHCQAEDSLHPVGPGVERLADEARATFPDARVDVFSSDTAQSPRAVREKVDAMAAGEIDILVGTQIVAKGHNFPNLTVVGVVDADLGLRGGDLRAGERTYQTLVQVAGRAGRADKPGRAFLQTCMPDHDAMRALAAGDRDAFLAAEIENRRVLGMPPFGRLAAVIVSGPDEDKLEKVARDIARAAPFVDGVDVLGPATPPLAVVRGKHRRRFLARADLSVDLSAYMAAWRARMTAPSSIRIVIDIDPYAFL